jgi:cytochrome c oxidase cbb3-type subunit 3
MAVRRRLVGLAVAAAALACIWVSASILSEHSRAAALVRADADEIPNDAPQLAFALHLAKPAYDRSCASCHGGGLRGDRAKGVPDLTAGRFLYGFGQPSELEHTIAYGIRSGRRKSWNLASMPAFATPSPYAAYKIEPLRPDEIDDVVEFLVASSGRAADPGAAERGQTVYTGKGLCFDCHSDDAKGDPSIGAPSLVGGAWLYGDGSRAALRNSVSFGHGGICPGWRGPFDAVTVRALALYVFVASHPAHAATVP